MRHNKATAEIDGVGLVDEPNSAPADAMNRSFPHPLDLGDWIFEKYKAPFDVISTTLNTTLLNIVSSPVVAPLFDFMEENDQAQAVPRLCRKGCGFYGSPNLDGFCSKCHRDMQATAEKVQSVVRLTSGDSSYIDDESDTPNSSRGLSNTSDEEKSPLFEISKALLSSHSPSSKPSDNLSKIIEKSVGASSEDAIAGDFDSSKATSSASSVASSEGTTKKRLRCRCCNKRVGLTGFSCRCGGLFCTIHRYSDSHDCPFDYRKSGQADIRKANPQIVCSKINKI